MRINIILMIVSMLAACSSCKNAQESTTPGVTQAADTVKIITGNTGYNWKASHVVEGSNPDSAGTYQIRQAPAWVEVPWQKIAPPSTSRRAFMSTGVWNVKMAYQPSDTLVHENYMGKTLRFREDQTFDIMQKGTVLETGHWAYDDPNKMLYISCKNTYFNNSWKLHENGFRMVWLGNTDINVTGIQIRLDGDKGQGPANGQ